MKHFNYLSLLITAVALVCIGCSKSTDDPKPDPVNIVTGTLYMHMHAYIGINEVDDYNITYSTEEGRKISLSLAQLYLSNIQLVKGDGSLYTIPDTIILGVREKETYLIANVPAGNYKSVRFHVGLDAAANQKTSSAVVLNQPAMWFGNAAQPDGYVFLNLQGKIDTTLAGNAPEAQMQPFVYKIGTDDHYKEVIMPEKDFTVAPNQAQYIHILADYSKLFNGIVLNNKNNLSVTTPSDNSSSLAGQLANNIPSLFMYEQ